MGLQTNQLIYEIAKYAAILKEFAFFNKIADGQPLVSKPAGQYANYVLVLVKMEI